MLTNRLAGQGKTPPANSGIVKSFPAGMKFGRELRKKGDFNLHRTVKPLSLCEYIISLTTYSHEAIVLDPFAGSGTTLVAAKNLERRFIGIDINKEYIEIAKRRIKSLEADYPGYNAVAGERQLKIFEGQVKYKRHGKGKLIKTA